MSESDSAEEIQKKWNSFYRFDPVTTREIRRSFLEDEYLNPVLPITLKDAFSLAVTRKKKFYYESSESDKGWFFGCGFKDKKNFGKLMDLQFEEFLKRKVKTVYYSNVLPDYLMPGVDAIRYRSLARELGKLGFTPYEEAISMEAEIGKMQYLEIAPSEFEVSSLRQGEETDFLSFVEKNFNSDCYYRAKGVAERGIKDQVVIARIGKRIVGYGMFSAGRGDMWYSPGERFGPFGVEDKERSKGIGALILAQLLNNMKGLGLKHAYFLWTSERATHLYTRFGFKVTRRFTIMRKDLSRPR